MKKTLAIFLLITIISCSQAEDLLSENNSQTDDLSIGTQEAIEIQKLQSIVSKLDSKVEKINNNLEELIEIQNNLSKEDKNYDESKNIIPKGGTLDIMPPFIDELTDDVEYIYVEEGAKITIYDNNPAGGNYKSVLTAVSFYAIVHPLDYQHIVGNGKIPVCITGSKSPKWGLINLDKNSEVTMWFDYENHYGEYECNMGPPIHSAGPGTLNYGTGKYEINMYYEGGTSQNPIKKTYIVEVVD
tara:strand:+ start:110 stop:838 length:729 start_codon:yes stop_codon:yes gene_type:complete